MKLKLVAIGIATSLLVVSPALILAATPTPIPGTATRMAQTSPTPNADVMEVTGEVPVPPGTPIHAEDLDPGTLMATNCGTAMTTPGESLTTSRFALTISRSCVAGHSNNIRICWAATACQAAVFQAGKTDLGLLSDVVDSHPPETGSGVTPTPIVSALPKTGAAEAQGRRDMPNSIPFLFAAGLLCALAARRVLSPRY